MSGAYRGDLEAAHARIAELEGVVAGLKDQEARVLDGRFPALEAEVARLRGVADPVASARRRKRIAIFGAVCPFLGMIFSYAGLLAPAVLCGGMFVFSLAMALAESRYAKANDDLLAEAEKKLADARRIAKLERQLAETKVRVASEASLDVARVVDEVESGGEAGVRRRA